MPSKHCETIPDNAEQLQKYLVAAVDVVQKRTWRKKYNNGFHVRKFYLVSDINVVEPRFLGDVTIWEYLYYANNRSLLYDQLKRHSLNTKLKFLAAKYLISSEATIPEEQLRVFADLRNQLSHNGWLPIQNPRSPFQSLDVRGCHDYMNLFHALTQALVLKAIGVDSIEKMKVRNVGEHLLELLDKGKVAHYHRT